MMTCVISLLLTEQFPGRYRPLHTVGLLFSTAGETNH